MRCHLLLRMALIAAGVLPIALAAAGCGTPGVSGPGTPDPALDTCRSDGDCVLAVRVDGCCPCPEVATEARLRATPALEIFAPGRDYAPLLPTGCGQVACAPCPPAPQGAVCSAGRCQAAEAVQSQPHVCFATGQ
jgi:hypothetical protein